jgi:hypothetical protein
MQQMRPDDDGTRGDNGNRSAAAGVHHVGVSAKEVAAHTSAITRLELELAVLELKRKAAAIGIGIGLAALAALLVLFMLAFALAAAAAGIATALPLWAALLIVAGGLALVVGGLGLAALASHRRATPPVPEQALREARLTSAAIRY